MTVPRNSSRPAPEPMSRSARAAVVSRLWSYSSPYVDAAMLRWSRIAAPRGLGVARRDRLVRQSVIGLAPANDLRVAGAADHELDRQGLDRGEHGLDHRVVGGRDHRGVKREVIADAVEGSGAGLEALDRGPKRRQLLRIARVAASAAASVSSIRRASDSCRAVVPRRRYSTSNGWYRRCPVSRRTNAPRLGATSIRRRSTSVRSASRTIGRLIPNSRASCRSEGRRSPTASWPVTTRSARMSASA